MFSMPKMEMVEFEVEAIMATSTDEVSSTERTYTTNPNQGPSDEF